MRVEATWVYNLEVLITSVFTMVTLLPNPRSFKSTIISTFFDHCSYLAVLAAFDFQFPHGKTARLQDCVCAGPPRLHCRKVRLTVIFPASWLLSYSQLLPYKSGRNCIFTTQGATDSFWKLSLTNPFSAVVLSRAPVLTRLDIRVASSNPLALGSQPYTLLLHFQGVPHLRLCHRQTLRQGISVPIQLGPSQSVLEAT